MPQMKPFMWASHYFFLNIWSVCFVALNFYAQINNMPEILNKKSIKLMVWLW